MKMTEADYQFMLAKIESTVKQWPMRLQVYADRYREAGKSEERFRWDVLYAAKVDVCPMYSYLSDTHIDTALKKIIAALL